MANALVEIEGYALPTPSQYVGLTATIVNAGRNVKGVTIGTVIREDVPDCAEKILSFRDEHS